MQINYIADIPTTFFGIRKLFSACNTDWRSGLPVNSKPQKYEHKSINIFTWDTCTDRTVACLPNQEPSKNEILYNNYKTNSFYIAAFSYSHALLDFNSLICNNIKLSSYTELVLMSSSLTNWSASIAIYTRAKKRGAKLTRIQKHAAVIVNFDLYADPGSPFSLITIWIHFFPCI